MSTTDAEGRERRGIYLPAELWDWLDASARRDGTQRSDLVEGLVLLARDATVAQLPACLRCGGGGYEPGWYCGCGPAVRHFVDCGRPPPRCVRCKGSGRIAEVGGGSCPG